MFRLLRKASDSSIHPYLALLSYWATSVRLRNRTQTQTEIGAAKTSFNNKNKATTKSAHGVEKTGQWKQRKNHSQEEKTWMSKSATRTPCGKTTTVQSPTKKSLTRRQRKARQRRWKAESRAGGIIQSNSNPNRVKGPGKSRGRRAGRQSNKPLNMHWEPVRPNGGNVGWLYWQRNWWFFFLLKALYAYWCIVFLPRLFCEAKNCPYVGRNIFMRRVQPRRSCFLQPFLVQFRHCCCCCLCLLLLYHVWTVASVYIPGCLVSQLVLVHGGWSDEHPHTAVSVSFYCL